MKPDYFSVEYGNTRIEYQVVRVFRQTVAIAVEPDMSVVVAAPIGSNDASIRALVRKRASWIIKQQSYFQQFAPRNSRRRFVSGETHLFLGRDYRLKVTHASVDGVRISRSFIWVESTSSLGPSSVENQMAAWYLARAQEQFAARLQVSAARLSHWVEIRLPSLRVATLAKNWGSINSRGQLVLNTRLVQAPIDSIDYVISHELCHLIEPNHSRAFWDLFFQVMPDWEMRKGRLEKLLA